MKTKIVIMICFIIAVIHPAPLHAQSDDEAEETESEKTKTYYAQVLAIAVQRTMTLAFNDGEKLDVCQSSARLMTMTITPKGDTSYAEEPILVFIEKASVGTFFSMSRPLFIEVVQVIRVKGAWAEPSTKRKYRKYKRYYVIYHYGLEKPWKKSKKFQGSNSQSAPASDGNQQLIPIQNVPQKNGQQQQNLNVNSKKLKL